MQKIIISVFGPDRPGILASVSRILFEEDCNIEDVTQTILQTEFAGIFIAQIPADKSVEWIEDRLNDALNPTELKATVKVLKGAAEPALKGKQTEPFVITTRGPDRKGLVAAITGVIAGYGVNVTHLKAVFRGGDNPYDNMMIYEVDIPVDIDRQRFHQELRQKAESLGLMISLQHRTIFETINRV
ncbi:glycine cleavage system protein R [Desulfatirhabdium butyrativorans]|uniref:glycine cleavage system protein R n=1 Tax=Desulfatirhabdium butyrativorans TaxID=340467 RepID=UPI0004216C42|nr:ACT domain-containing protein [Desulfatirhabdium butyrativorans]